jgi:photosystem II stability/assembly factor-like uncharacterized protein
MAKDFTICIGTVGAGVWYSPNCGEKWRRSKMKLPFQAEPGEVQIRALAVYPDNAQRLLSGSEVGVYRSEDKGASWELLESPMDGKQIWSLAVHPTNTDIIYAGTKEPGVYRSLDGGQKWEQLRVPIADRCFAGAPKVTNIVFDPRNPDTIWVGVEIDGVYCSRDGGNSWVHLPPLGKDMLNGDIHGLTVCQSQPTKLLATTPDGIWASTTEGENWSLHGFPKFFERDQISYCRGVAVKADNPDVMFVGNGDFIPGKTGAIQRSTDGGKTWKPAQLSVEPNSTIYWFGTHPADPDVIVANSLNGYVYTSVDGGESWKKVRQEFGEIRAVAWVPN